MKLLLPLLFLLSQTIMLYADKNWIPIQSTNKTQTPKSATNLDVNLSQLEPINKIIKNATVIKQLIDATSKKDKSASDEKKWFMLHTN